MLSAAQFILPIEIAALNASVQEVQAFAELKALQETTGKFQSIHVDATEFACLRAIVLLKTPLGSQDKDGYELRDREAIDSLQIQARLALSKYVSRAYPWQPQRFGKLLLLLSNLNAISERTINSVFFTCIGSIPLGKIICDMFKDHGV